MENIDFNSNVLDLTGISSEKELIEILTSQEFKNRINDHYGFNPCKINTVSENYYDITLIANITNAWTERDGNFLLIVVIDNEEDFHKILYYNENEGRFKPDNGDFLENEGWPYRYDWNEDEEHESI